MNCPACGGHNRDGAHFCRHCGLALDVQPPAVEAAPVTPSAEPALAAPGGQAEPGTPAATPEPPTDAPVGATEQPSLNALAAPPSAAVEEPEASSPPAETPPAAGEVAPTPLPADAEESPALPAPTKEIPAFAPSADTPAGVAAVPPEPEPSPLVPLPPGTVIGGRFVVLEPRAAGPAEILYDARDLCRCWQCGFGANAPDDAFCAQCGASLERKRTVRLLEVRGARAEPGSGEAVTERFDHDGRTFLLLAEPPAGSASVEAAAPTALDTRLLAGYRSDVGQARELNEDSLLVLDLVPAFRSRARPLLGLFAVADGMGGHEGGEVASRLALQVLAEQAARDILLAELAGGALEEQDLAARLARAVEAANDAVYLARHKRGSDMGTTLTVALVRDGRLFLAHVGDSRAYRWDSQGLRQLTTDHSLVASLIATGRVAPEEIYTHPQRNVIYRNVGDQPTVEVESVALPLAPGDRLLLCSDGLWEMIHDEGIQDGLMQEADPQAACDLLVKRANAAGGEDNISVVVVRVDALP